ncbi:HK97-gp10 family putative phage morphogenesis protein [Lichenifustis flavocetrariae]|uniref:HK97 gp10 family phage protein n=1 Tax=Lichenifustis flavocetrariae TaxID=2949735 RepID=A0AA42CKW8_9HYPH|nr:HK97-gp10 family putative phage morphogenesis protein [Lichenifustis flavocetrariae]MCW6510983.1 hypothetical protein [Lichenifustis flavocetrariae]
MTPTEAKRRLGGLPATLQAATEAALDRVAETVATEARRSLGAAGPSAPGAAPADPAGTLAAAIGTAREGDGTAMVNVAAPFAAALEYGTRHMAARPFLRPAVAATGEAARQIMAEAFAQAIAQAEDDA